jgi:hypothetical protein
MCLYLSPLIYVCVFLKKVLRLAEGSLTVSSYTNSVDTAALAEPKKTARRTQKQVCVARYFTLLSFFSFLLSIVV